MPPHEWGLAFKKLLEVRGVERGKGKRNDRTCETVSQVAGELGVDRRTAHNRMKAADVYEQLPEEWQAQEAGRGGQ